MKVPEVKQSEMESDSLLPFCSMKANLAVIKGETGEAGRASGDGGTGCAGLSAKVVTGGGQVLPGQRLHLSTLVPRVTAQA